MHWYYSFGWTSSHVSPTVLLSKMHIGLLEIALRTSWSLSVGPSRFGRGCLLCLYLPVSMHGLLWLAEQSSLLFSCFKKQNCFSVKGVFYIPRLGVGMFYSWQQMDHILVPFFFLFSFIFPFSVFSLALSSVVDFFGCFFLFLLMNISTKFRGMRLCPRLYEELKHVFSKRPSVKVEDWQ